MAKLIQALVASAVLFSHPALARQLPDGGVTPGEVAAALQANGMKAELGKDSGGDPKISSAVDGSSFTIFFYVCEKGRCHSIQFAAGFDLKSGTDLASMNKWNSDYRFATAHLDDENDPHLTMDMDVERGTTEDALANEVERWEAVLTSFKKHIKWE
jgi:Putative bacterial sensory transduction regulator